MKLWFALFLILAIMKSYRGNYVLEIPFTNPGAILQNVAEYIRTVSAHQEESGPDVNNEPTLIEPKPRDTIPKDDKFYNSINKIKDNPLKLREAKPVDIIPTFPEGKPLKETTQKDLVAEYYKITNEVIDNPLRAFEVGKQIGQQIAKSMAGETENVLMAKGNVPAVRETIHKKLKSYMTNSTKTKSRDGLGSGQNQKDKNRYKVIQAEDEIGKAKAQGRLGSVQDKNDNKVIYVDDRLEVQQTVETIGKEIAKELLKKFGRQRRAHNLRFI